MTVEMSPKAISARLFVASKETVLQSDRRLDAKINLSPKAISARIITVSNLRDLCAHLGRAARRGHE